jgi:vancomycin resistance protein YoaR
MRLTRAATILAVWGAFGLASWCCARLLERASKLTPDALLEQWVLPEPSTLVPFVHSVRSRDAAKTVYLDAEGGLLRVSLSDLGIELDVEGTVEQARRAPQLNSTWDRIRRVLSGPPEKPLIIEPIFVFDVNEARRTLDRLAPLVNRKAVDARLDYANHRRIEAEPGRELDIAATFDTILHASLDEGDVVALQFRSVPARVESRELPAVDVSRILSQYETSFLHRAGARAINIRRGTQLLDGFLLLPNAVFSFNRVIGPRAESRGFIDAPVIVNDEIDKGVGGGICQVASTLHAAALYAGLPIVERRSHSRPSGYAPLGLDATVIEGKVDLRFTNPYGEPLLIHAFLPTTTTIRVEILGREPEWKVEHNAQVIKRYPFLRRIVQKPEITSGEFKRSQKGTYGYDIVSVVRYTDRSGAVTTQKYKSNYYPVPEVFWVSPGTPLASLPPLPEGAEGIEDRD